MSTSLNVAARLKEMSAQIPDHIAVVEPLAYGHDGHRQYRDINFRQLEADSNRIASGLRKMGVTPGTKVALLVRPGIDFVSLVFALFKAGVVSILIDPGMGRKNMIRCLEAAEPEGFVAIPAAQAVRAVLRHRFPKARFNVTVGDRWCLGQTSLADVRTLGFDDFDITPTQADDPAAIIFTTGSTGPPKGVLYRHGNFDRQVTELRDFYGIEPGEIDLPGFPLFGLFNCALGVTTVIPDMDPTRPAQCDPAKIVEAIHDWRVTQAFGSPAIWNRVGRYCEAKQIKLPTLKRVLSAGAPVPPHVLARMMACIHPAGEVHTPYGATESLPVASIGAREVLGETSLRSTTGAGTCVGRRFPGLDWKVIRIVDGPIVTLADAHEEPRGAIGELIVSGPVVTREYVTRRESNALGKISDGDRIWHRMGDVGYFDQQDRFWFCGRMAHRVITSRGTMFTIPCEAIFNNHPAIYRSALVGVGPAGQQTPAIVAEPWSGRMPKTDAARDGLLAELRELGASSPLTASIEYIFLHPALPVDIRHNAKIFREKLAVWAAEWMPVKTH